MLFRSLERHRGPKVPPDFVLNQTSDMRIVASAMDHILNLETSTCTRLLTESGALTEVVDLDGIRGELMDEDLEQFVQSFPVEKIERGRGAAPGVAPDYLPPSGSSPLATKTSRIR